MKCFRINVRTIIENRGDIEALKVKARRSKCIHITSIVVIPLIIYSLIGYCIVVEQNGKVADNLQPLFIFMLVTRVALLLAFVLSGFCLLLSLKKYSLQIYNFSKFKVKFSGSL